MFTPRNGGESCRGVQTAQRQRDRHCSQALTITNKHGSCPTQTWVLPHNHTHPTHTCRWPLMTLLSSSRALMVAAEAPAPPAPPAGFLGAAPDSSRSNLSAYSFTSSDALSTCALRVRVLSGLGWGQRLLRQSRAEPRCAATTLHVLTRWPRPTKGLNQLTLPPTQPSLTPLVPPAPFTLRCPRWLGRAW